MKPKQKWGHQFENEVHGLCGTFNNRQDDDFRSPDGAMEMSAVSFGNSWKGVSICEDESEETNNIHPCETYLELRPSAVGSCDAIMSGNLI